VTEREEVLGRLQIDLGTDRQLPLLRFRGQVGRVCLQKECVVSWWQAAAAQV
jgi:hypothetical protein